jgi:hypothetical protein
LDSHELKNCIPIVENIEITEDPEVQLESAEFNEDSPLL